MAPKRKGTTTTTGRGAGARSGAPAPAAPRRAPEQGQYLTFPIGAELYAVPVLETSEVLGHQESTPIPGAPTWIHGLLNIRGKAVPVIDLATKFGAERERGHGSAAGSSCIIVLEVVLDEEPAQVGLIADDMPAVVAVGAEQISDPPLFGTLVHARYLRGMARIEAGLVLILDAVGALTAQEVAQLRELDSGPRAGDDLPAPPAGGEEHAGGRSQRAGD
jgi:purine-binding chemotaxis protein CheW